MTMRSGAIDLEGVLDGIASPSLEVPDLCTISRPQGKDLFAPKKRAAWKEKQADEARCDFAPNKVRISYRHPSFGIISLWQKSVYGRTLSDIKSDYDMVEQFAVGVANLIKQIIGSHLKEGDWAIVTAPCRRHKERNFATLISARLAELLGIRFYSGLVECKSKHRVGAIFNLTAEPPTERNIIVFDDFVTSGATMISMHNLLAPKGYNLVHFAGVSNKI